MHDILHEVQEVEQEEAQEYPTTTLLSVCVHLLGISIFQWDPPLR